LNHYLILNNLIKENTKFIIESTNLNHINPSIINKTLIIHQEGLEWHNILESRINEVCFKFSVPKSKTAILHEYSRRYFQDLHTDFKSLSYKSMLHGNIFLKDMSFLNFILSYSNIIDCLIKKHHEELKLNNEDDVSNWKCLLSISAYAFFWSIANYLTNEEDLNHFNNLAIEIIKKNKCDIHTKYLYDSEVDIKSNSLKQFQRIVTSTNKDWIITDYQLHAYLIKLFIENGKPCLVYGDIGVGKTSLIEKLLTNKYDYAKLTNISPHTYTRDTFYRLFNFTRNKKHTSINNYKYDFVYFIDDLNINYTCYQNNKIKSNLEFVRQLIETQSIYDDDYYKQTTRGMNLLLCCSYPNRSINYLPLSQSQTKETVTVHLNVNPISLIKSIFSSQVEHWLEEFPADSVQYPKEMGQSIIKSLTEIYLTIKEFLRPSPARPYYLFNFKDIARVIQGLQLLASKSKVVPTKISKKTQQDQAVQQVATIIKLFVHETMRVFNDRLTETNDEKFFRSLIINSVSNNFCTPKQEQQESYDLFNKYVINDDEINFLEVPKQKKGVTFKTGLVSERMFDGYEGVLITKDQVIFL
jgi:hypothetical protein